MLVRHFHGYSDLEELRRVFLDPSVRFLDCLIWMPFPRFPLSSSPGFSSLLLSQLLFAPVWRFYPLAWFLDELELPVRDNRDQQSYSAQETSRERCCWLSTYGERRKSLTLLVSCCCFNPAPYRAPVTAKPAATEARMSGRAFNGFDVIELAIFDLHW